MHFFIFPMSLSVPRCTYFKLLEIQDKSQCQILTAYRIPRASANSTTAPARSLAHPGRSGDFKAEDRVLIVRVGSLWGKQVCPSMAGVLPQDERQEREIFVCHTGNLRHEYIGAGVAVARHIHSTAIIHRNAIAFIIPVAAKEGIPL